MTPRIARFAHFWWHLPWRKAGWVLGIVGMCLVWVTLACANENGTNAKAPLPAATGYDGAPVDRVSLPAGVTISAWITPARAAPGTVVELHLQISLPPGWLAFDLEQVADSVLPTQIRLENSNAFAAIEAFEGPAALERVEPRMNHRIVRYFDRSPTFRRRILIPAAMSAGTYAVRGTIDFQLLDDTRGRFYLIRDYSFSSRFEVAGMVEKPRNLSAKGTKKANKAELKPGQDERTAAKAATIVTIPPTKVESAAPPQAATKADSPSAPMPVTAEPPRFTPPPFSNRSLSQTPELPESTEKALRIAMPPEGLAPSRATRGDSVLPPDSATPASVRDVELFQSPESRFVPEIDAALRWRREFLATHAFVAVSTWAGCLGAHLMLRRTRFSIRAMGRMGLSTLLAIGLAALVAAAHEPWSPCGLAVLAALLGVALVVESSTEADAWLCNRENDIDELPAIWLDWRPMSGAVAVAVLLVATEHRFPGWLGFGSLFLGAGIASALHAVLDRWHPTQPRPRVFGPGLAPLLGACLQWGLVLYACALWDHVDGSSEWLDDRAVFAGWSALAALAAVRLVLPWPQAAQSVFAQAVRGLAMLVLVISAALGAVGAFAPATLLPGWRLLP